MLGGFSSPDWDDGVEHSGTPSVDETSADHPCVVLSRGLKRSTNNGPCSSNPNCLDTAVAITEGTADKAAHESTEIVDRNDTTLQKRVVDDRGACDGICVAKFHGVVVVVWCGVDTAHHSLVITKEEDGQGSYTIDGSEEALFLQLVDHIGLRNEIHCGDRYCQECLVLCKGLMVSLEREDERRDLLSVGQAVTGGDPEQIL